MSSELDSVKPLNPPKRRLSLAVASKLAIAIILLLLVLFAAIPNYLQGRGVGTQPIPVQNIKALRELPETGLKLPGWTIRKQEARNIGGHPWLLQSLVKDEQIALLLLRPQKDNKSQPEVDWVDLRNYFTNTRDRTTVNFTVNASNIKANLFQAFTDRQAYAVMQWYSWETGGSPAPVDWFLADQRAQLRDRRLPWIAVNLQIPIDPLADVADVETEMIELGKTVQQSLLDNVLQESESGQDG
ncbi:MAG: cyanoexosortase B system-associated protein [Jaaginema sp. PMC 1080.18]|nr:cyanoexosortase B system-associated protein [Jaaginema sp. PMC 1080.18]MEC4864932.1 cyanoexosortase B system-associated protein [Jaaginema sp. PMC 1078.18]